MSSLRIPLLAVLVLAGCGRDTTEADVKLVGVGMDPDEIGPAPSEYGGVVEYAHVEFAGGGLPLGLLGLLSYDPVGPSMNLFEPPYEAVVGFSYVFDQKLRISSFSSFTPDGPPALDTCVTLVEPSGPIGQFTTVDVGDFMSFYTEDGERGLRVNRVPADYPPDPQGMFVYYFAVESYRPEARTRPVAAEDAPNDPLAMEEKAYLTANFPFGEEVTWGYPGGFSYFDQPVGSIPLPSTAGDPNTLRIPDRVGPVALEWQGPRYDAQGAVVDSGAQKRCLRFYDPSETGPDEIGDCDDDVTYPTSFAEYDSFAGQIYTGPWDTEDGRVVIQWEAQPEAAEDEVLFTLRFLAPIDPNDTRVPAVEMSGGRFRDAQQCEEWDAEFLTPEELYDYTESTDQSVQGDPNSRLVEVTCRLEDDGEFELTPEMYSKALAQATEKGAAGSIFMITRKNEIGAEVLPVKDQYDQRHDISPVKFSATSTRIGRFWWGDPTTSSGE